MKKMIKVVSAVALASTLAACGKTKTVEKKVEWTDEEKVAWATENGYVKAEVEDTRAELEVAFGETMSAIDAPYLKNYIGTKEGDETFGEKKDILVFYGINECTTCEAVKPVVNAWVKATGNKVYYYNPDNSAANAVQKEGMLKKLGSTNGTELTGGQLIAFVDGVYKGSIEGVEGITAEKIDAFVAKYFKDDLGAKTVKTSKELETLADLRKSIANNEQFILYATRFNCPWCRKLADTGRDNALNKLMRSYTGNLYTITSEKVLNEYNAIYVKGSGDSLALAEAGETGAVNVWEYWYSLDNGAKPDFNNVENVPAYWPNTTTAVQKAEVLLYLVATGEVGANVTSGQLDQLAFIKEVAAYAASTDTKKFTRDDRNIPAFIAVGWTEAQEEANTTAISAIISRRPGMVNVSFGDNPATTDVVEPENTISIVQGQAHRALFPEYFTGATSGKTQVDYVTPEEEVTAAYYYLTMWVNSWTYNTAA